MIKLHHFSANQIIDVKHVSQSGDDIKNAPNSTFRRILCIIYNTMYSSVLPL